MDNKSIQHEQALIIDEIQGLIRWASREPKAIAEISKQAQTKLEYLVAKTELETTKIVRDTMLKNLK